MFCHERRQDGVDYVVVLVPNGRYAIPIECLIKGTLANLVMQQQRRVANIRDNTPVLRTVARDPIKLALRDL